MRRAIRWALAAAVATAGAAAAGGAQDAAGRPPDQFALDNLRTPTSPAFTILGVTPTSIARPATPRALALELLSSTRVASVIPNSYALEAAPYWLRPRPRLTFDQFTRPTAAQSLRQSFALSFATARDESAEDTAATRVAAGARAVPLGGRPSAAFRALTASLDSIQRTRVAVVRRLADSLDVADSLAAALQEAVAATAAAEAAGDAARARAARARVDAVRARDAAVRASAAAIERALATQADTMGALARAMGEQDAERVGWFAELAGALAANFPGDRFDGGRVSRLGAWGTLSYRLERPRLDVIALVRVQRDRRGGGQDADQNAVDAGGRLLWLRDRLGISAEVVSRRAGDADGTNGAPSAAFASGTRAVGTAEYRVADAMYVTASFGQDHPTPGTSGRPLVAILGVNFQLGDKPTVTLPR